MIFYHGSNKLFDDFDTEYSFHDGEIYISPCKLMSIQYTTRQGGYLYTLEVDESIPYRESMEYGKMCGCRAYKDVSGFKILKVERIEYDGVPMRKTECGNHAVIFSRYSVPKEEL